MKEYIEREAAVSELNRIEKLYQNTYMSNVRAEMASYCCQVIKHIPAADVVEVVRCKDCKAYGEMLPGKDSRMICHKWALNFEPNHYCSYGARKDGGVNDEQRVH